MKEESIKLLQEKLEKVEAENVSLRVRALIVHSCAVASEAFIDHRERSKRIVTKPRHARWVPWSIVYLHTVAIMW